MISVIEAKRLISNHCWTSKVAEKPLLEVLGHVAQATVRVGKQETIDAIQNKTVHKGDVLEASRIAGLFAIKKTSEIIPDRHPMPVEFAANRHRIKVLDIVIETEVQSIYCTGIEVEAMHGASVAALTIYDMLKPIDKEIEIKNIKLISNKWSINQYKDVLARTIKAAVIVCSDSISAGKKEDFAGKAIIKKLENIGGIQVDEYVIIPDEITKVREKAVKQYEHKTDLIIFTGGTGLSARDVIPEAVRPLLDREIPGISEVVRSNGQEHMPYAMLSRSLVGLKGRSLILALPGSICGAVESLNALFPYLLQIFKILENSKHD